MQSNYNSQSSYSAFTRPRPIRIAFLLDPSNTSEDLLNTILEFNLQLWGGRYNPIIPCNGAEITESFWRLLVFSDPDIVISYIKLQDDLIEKIDREVSPYYFTYANDNDKRPSRPQLHGRDPITNEFLIKDINSLGLKPFYAPKYPLVVFKMRETSPNRGFLLRNFGHLPYMLQFLAKPGDREWRPELKDTYRDIDTYQIDGDNELAKIIDELSKKRTLIYPVSISSLPISPPAKIESYNDHGFLLAIGDDILNFLYLWNRSHITASHTFDQMVIPEGILDDMGCLNSIKQLLVNYVGTVLTLISSDKTTEELSRLAEFFEKDTHWRVKTISSEGFCFPMIAKSDYVPLYYENTGDTYKFYDKTALIPNKGPVSTDNSFFSQKGSWVLDTDITYRPERFSYTNQEYWWKLPRRSGISFIFYRKGLSRINKYGSISFEVDSTEKNIEVLIPDDMSVFWELISPSHSYAYRDDIRREKVVHYELLHCSEKGQYLDGVVGLFPSLWHANNCFKERLWRKIFAFLCNVQNKREDNVLTEIRGKVGKALRIAIQEHPDKIKQATEYLSLFINSLIKKTNYERFLRFDYLLKIANEEREEFLKRHADRKEEFAYTQDDLIKELNDALQQFTESKIIFQGARPRCSFCGYTNWITLNEVSDQITCKGCHSKFDFPVEAEWYYHLNELVRKTILNQGIMATILCLGQLLSESRKSFIYVPNVNLYDKYRDENPDAELDIMCISDRKFIIGEVKNSAKLITQSVISGMEELARKLRPDRVVMYAFEGPHKKAIQLTQTLRERLEPFGIEVNYMQPPDYINDPTYHV